LSLHRPYCSCVIFFFLVYCKFSSKNEALWERSLMSLGEVETLS
jgi:hypothetical protein